ncbi:3-deoxy-D-manno-octulosonic acid transferase [Rhodovulum euryhalinum]|uniref:3-deoxy-D-manno-octulosonic acid transferase n=1 Tax=Rhodovulum euryhalinum TaxID=35805 RepID=A0A4V2S9Z4_9RHOB|nr:3-deoxy-D-manno-octulosonic acid transferase [Rhodovulum euryhalinum]TCO68890.1 3-deoxy-D-manno-octulosonic-acid transferase [Rhodovulum euryhalinum]
MRTSTPILRAYLAFSAVADPLVRWHQKRRLAAGKEIPGRLAERQGKASCPRPSGRLVWFHAASVGESLSLIGLIQRLLAEDPGLSILVTSTTATSARMLADILPARAVHQFAPFDSRAAVRRFLDHWRPDLAVWTESELWPRLLVETDRRGIPMLLINARISDRTMARWRRWPRTAGALLSPFRAILVQEAPAADLMRAIGVADGVLTVTGSLKEELPPPEVRPDDLAALRTLLGDRRRWLAASTHEGEEEVLVDAHDRAFGRGDGAPLLIVAPRHPDRGPALAGRLDAQGWRVALRSAGGDPGADTQIYVADTLGEMGLWYRLCPVAFVGGSLARVGGHNPYEPAQLDCVVIHGPHVFNFAGIYARLARVEGAVAAGSADEIAVALHRLSDADTRAALTRAARGVLESGSSATGAALAAIRAELGPGGVA